MNPFYENRKYAIQASEPKSMEFPEHLHGHVEILAVRQGRIEVQVMDQRRELEEGDWAVIFPQQIHSYHSPVENLTRLVIFDSSLAGAYLNSVQKYAPGRPFLTAAQLPEDAVLALDRLYRLSGNGGVDAGDCSGADAQRISTAWIQVLFALLLPCLELVRRDRSEGAELICTLVQYIMEHFQEQLTLETLSRELHVNKYYISSVFSNRLGLNFRRYLNRIRLEYAVQLMDSTDAPLTAVWAEAGFNSQRSFNRVFAEVMGVTPMEYRHRSCE